MSRTLPLLPSRTGDDKICKSVMRRFAKPLSESLLGIPSGHGMPFLSIFPDEIASYPIIPSKGLRSIPQKV
ncbi:MAG: hypothetical protein D6812_04445 [Deltaproteobacteria bacterium]|nr:MAG: hypothetical protein D6812_04445 [Deltaproteobacteria bacterium]